MVDGVRGHRQQAAREFAQLVAITFFVGSLLFTTGGALQVWLAVPQRRADGAGRAAWWTAAVQFAGTLFFNITTFRALQTPPVGFEYAGGWIVCQRTWAGGRAFRISRP